MQSSFRKLYLNETGALPTRKVHGTAKLLNDVPQIDTRRLLVSLERRLTILKEELQHTYASQFESGRAVGYQQGFEDGRKEAAGLVAAADKELQDLRGEREVFIQEYKEDIVDLVVTICNKLLLEEVVKSENVVRLVEDALVNLNPPLEATVYCPPEIKHNLHSAADKLASAARGSVEIIADPLLPDRTIRVESENSVLDINVQKELAAIARELGVAIES